MTSIPETGYLRLAQILGNAKRGLPPLIPVSASTWWEGIRAGRYPAGVKIGAHATGWRCEDIRKLLAEGVTAPESRTRLDQPTDSGQPHQGRELA